MCNWARGNNDFEWHEFVQATSMIDALCGADGAGHVTVHKWGKGYGRTNVGVWICAGRYDSREAPEVGV